MKKDLCADCVFNTMRGGLSQNCLCACTEVRKISGDPAIVLVCEDYVPGEPLSVEISPEELHSVYERLFPERVANGGYPVDEPEYKRRRYIYRVTFYINADGRQYYGVDVGAVNGLQAIATAKALWHMEGCVKSPRETRARRVDKIEFFKFTPLALSSPAGTIIRYNPEQEEEIDRLAFGEEN